MTVSVTYGENTRGQPMLLHQRVACEICICSLHRIHMLRIGISRDDHLQMRYVRGILLSMGDFTRHGGNLCFEEIAFPQVSKKREDSNSVTITWNSSFFLLLFFHFQISFQPHKSEGRGSSFSPTATA